MIDKDIYIYTIKEFSKVINDNDVMWKLLVGKEISRFDQEVKYRIQYKNISQISLSENSQEIERGIKYYSKGRVSRIYNIDNSQEILIEVNYQNEFKVKYQKSIFIQQFNYIYPTFALKEVLTLLEIEENFKKEELQKAEAREQKLKKQEADKIEADRVKKQKSTLLENLQYYFDYKFLDYHKFYINQCAHYISLSEYEAKKSNYVQKWVKINLNTLADHEQATAIGAVEGHVQVVARAGSGKTSTIVNRALFLQKHCGIAPNEILLLAFNKKAAEEIKDRLCSKLESSIPHVMTFHALAYALVHPEKSILFDEPDDQQSKSRMLQKVIDEYLQNNFFYKKIQALMMAHFRQDWELLVLKGYDKTPEEMLRYRRSLPREGIDGNYVKSYGEKIIADFLFEHNISYRYEYNFWWDGINYRPDFTIFTDKNKGIVIEYFGLEGDSEYDDMSDKKRKYWENKANWHLIELTPKIINDEGTEYFLYLLKQELEYLGVTCDRLSEEEIWQRVKVRAIDRFTKVVVSFIQRCRKLSLTPEQLMARINAHSCASEGEQQFLELAQKFYQTYLERLELTGEDDFDGMLQKSAVCVKSGQTIFRRKSGAGDLKSLRYILIDEYQDFSNLFYQLIAAIKEQNPQVNFFCVGDDWQAINGFAGSDLRFYGNFAKFFDPSQKLYISINYRSASSIVDVGNKLMQGLGTPARASKEQLGLVEVADLAQFEPTQAELEDHRNDHFTPAILRLVSEIIKTDKSVVLLCRKNRLPWNVNYKKKKVKSTDSTLDAFLSLVRSYLPDNKQDKVTISTSHKYKGLEKDVVIILDAVPNCYPLIHPDFIFNRIFGDTIEKVINEERRLFYVALTRAIDHLIIVTENDNYSPFLEELNNKRKISFLNWLDYPPLLKVKRITAKVGNQPGKSGNGTYSIKHLLKNEGYSWKCQKQAWCRTYPVEEFSIQKYFDSANWISQAVGIEVSFYDELEKKLAVYHVYKGVCNPIFDNIPKIT